VGKVGVIDSDIVVPMDIGGVGEQLIVVTADEDGGVPLLGRGGPTGPRLPLIPPRPPEVPAPTLIRGSN